MNQGREPLVVLQNLASFYLNLLVAKTAPNRSNLVAVTSTTWQALCEEAQYWELDTILRGQQHLKESEAQIKNTTQPRLWLEVALLGLLPSAYRSQTAIAPPPPTSQVSLSRRTTQPSSPASSSTTPPKPFEVESRKSEVGSNASSASSSTTSPKPLEVESNSETVRESLEPKLEEQLEEPSTPISSTEQIPANEIWQAVIDRVQPFTQMIVRSNCHLIGLDEHMAYLGVKNHSLLAMVKGKLAEIETAFKVVVGHRVNVNLQVATPDDSKAFIETKSRGDNYNKHKTEEKIQASNATINEPSKPPEVRPIEQPIEPPPLKQSSLPVVSEPIVKNNKSLETQSNTIELQDDLTVELDEPEIEFGDRNENAIPDYVRDELQKAAQYLAKSFEGEIVSWDRFIDEDSLTTNQQEPSLADSNTLAENELETSQPEPTNPQIVRQKLDLTQFTDEEDIPF
jgi:DNA polymerase-3 subunit gamma/tau